MGGIPLPALDARVPQSDPAGEIGKLVQMKSILQGQQLQQGQIQLQQQQLKDQQAMTQAMKTWDGKDYDALSKSVLQNGGSANAATQIQQHGLTIKKTVSDIAAQDATSGSKNLETFIGKQKAIGDALQGIESVPDEQLHDIASQKVQALMQGGILDPQTGQKALQGIQSTQDPKALRDQIDIFAKASMGAKAAAEQQKTTAETRKSNAEAGKAEQETQFYNQNPSAGAPGVPAETVSLMDYMRTPQKPGEPMHTPANFPAWKAKQEATQTMPIKVQQAAAEAAATQPYKIQTAEAEGRARQLIQGMEKPVYAIKPDGSKELMSATTALQSGIKTMLPVTEKEVGEDTMLINRLGDVRQKITRYEQAMAKPIDQPDRAAIASLISSDHFKPGIFGFEMTADTLKNLSKQADIKVLSPGARDRLVAYYNARESLTGYNRVLSGTGKSSEKNMELQLDTLADPAASDADYAARSFRDFRENLGVVGQGLPKIPGVKSPEEIEAQVTGPKAKTSDPLGIR